MDGHTNKQTGGWVDVWMGRWVSGWWISNKMKKVARSGGNGPSTQAHGKSQQQRGGAVLRSQAQALGSEWAST